MSDVNYDFGIPTISGQKITVQWLVADPRRIYRMLNTLVQQRLIGDRLLSGRVDLTGTGAGIYEVSEGIFADLQSQTVSPLSEYPLTTTTPGTLAAIKPLKDGLRSLISDETIAHNRIDKVLRDLRKIANTLLLKNDGLSLAAVASLVTQTQAASAVWTGSSGNPFTDVMLASAKIEENNKGYVADVVATTPTGFAYAISRAATLNYLPRETNASALASGTMARIGGLTFLKTTNMPSGMKALVADSSMLGSQAYEDLGGNYQGDPGGVQSKRWREEGVDGVNVQARMVKAPMVQEPLAGCAITGTGL